MRLVVCVLSIILTFLFLNSCRTLPSKLSGQDPNNLAIQNIRLLTDQTLVALATHNYDQLKQFISPDDQHLTGPQAARLLLGPQTASWIIERWDARVIQVSFHNNQLQATATGFVLCKPKPNRKPVKSRFLFHFSRPGLHDPWTLLLTRP